MNIIELSDKEILDYALEQEGLLFADESDYLSIARIVLEQANAKFAELLQAQASEPVAWILDHTPNRGMRQVSCAKPYVDNEMSKGAEWNPNKFSQGQYPYDVCTPLCTSPPNTQDLVDKLSVRVGDVTQMYQEKLNDTQAKLDKAREALQKLRTETHDVYEGVGEKALINKLVNAGHIVDMAIKEIE